jgi:hypothetical protein
MLCLLFRSWGTRIINKVQIPFISIRFPPHMYLNLIWRSPNISFYSVRLHNDCDWVIVALHKMSHFSAISWQEKVKFDEMIMMSAPSFPIVDWFEKEQILVDTDRDNVSNWSDMFTRRLLFQWASSMKIQLSVLVRNFSAISWREQVNFQWNDDEVLFVLDQHA